MGDNKRRNHRRSNNWCSQDGINQHCSYSGRTRSRAQSAHRKSKRSLSSPTINSKLVESPLNPSLLPTNFVSLNDNHSNDKKSGVESGLSIAGIVVGSLIVLTIIIYCLIRFIKKGKKPSEDEEEVELPNPRELTLNFVKHNHPIPELCTTPDTQPILDYYSSKAGLTKASSPPIINSNKLNSSDNNDDDKSTPVDVNINTKESSEENINNEHVPQYYNGMEIPPLGARIIPLERQVQIAKESTSSNLSPITHHKRKSNRSISSILSISSRRKSSTSSINNNSNNNNNSSTTSTLTLIREAPRNEGNENAANIDP